jgi:hypothetical protein
MKPSRLQEILAAAEQGQATINEAVEIAGASLASTSRHSAEIKQMLQDIITRMSAMQEQIDFLYQHNSPIYAAVLQDEADEEEGSESEFDDSDSEDETED